MLKRILFTVVIAALCTTVGFSQMTFNVSPGMNLNSASFGYKIGDRIVPYVGFQYMKASYDYEYISNYTSPQNTFIDEDQVSFKGSLLIPNIGVKAFFLSKNDVKAYGNIMLSKPILNGEIEYDGEVEEDFVEGVEGISLFGLQAGVGCEYFFSENFSLGGEFGLRYFKFSTDYKEESSNYNEFTDTYSNSMEEGHFNLGVSPTYNKVTLNFYF